MRPGTLAAAALAALGAAAACGPPPSPRRFGPAAPRTLSLTPRITRDDQVHRAVAAPEFLKEVPPPPGSWLRLEFRDPANPTAVVLEFFTECPEIESRAVPCGGGHACLVSWRLGEERLAGGAALSLGEHAYWWPGPVAYCARVSYSLGPGPYAAALERFVVDLPTHVRPARRRPPAAPPASAPVGDPAPAGGR